MSLEHESAQETGKGAVVSVEDGHRPWSILAVVGIAQMLAMLDSTVVNVALPSIGDDLSVSSQALQWTISGYVLTYGSLLLFGGRLADALGRRLVFLLGVSLFVVASVGAGLASTGAVLVTSRVVQGVGAAVLSASALSIIIATYRSDRQRNIALTVWSGLGVIGATIGVIFGGLVVEYVSWRWVFLANVPIGVVLALAALQAVAPMRREPGSRRLPLRLPSAVAVTFALCCMSYAFIDLQDGADRSRPWGFLVVGAVVLAAIVEYERRSTDPLLPLFLMRIKTFSLACAGMVMAATLLLGSLYLGSNYFQKAGGLTPLETGFALLPLCAGSLVAAFGIPSVAEKIGMPRVYLGGVLVQFLAVVALAAVIWNVGSSVPTGVVIALLGVYGLGLPTMFVPLYTFGAAEIPERHSGTGSGLLNTFNEAGAGIGLAIVAPVAAYIAGTQASGGTPAPSAEAHGIAAGFTVAGACSLIAGLIAVAIVRAFRIAETAGT
ncbi:drug resistance transporter, EmrB/QacA subfamily [Haloechinothrix alba]|uniref:Drug resistance transporter, EmrB/QacA subfamily n=1 Tax=Haloechinothrix alba TaxID=664784 RepID=A0A238XYB8_9PSEU|nr:MFS transporter [Haloechinothrix alba]SNR63413.1 drug resistance transporter, EmrB/QacA subfamily [Haloechinothrix alba]